MNSARRRSRSTGDRTGLASRQRAHEILHAVLDRKQHLDSVLERDHQFLALALRDRAFVRNLVATTLRRLGQIDAIISSRLQTPLPATAVAARNALRLGVCQLLFLDTRTHAAVDTSVTLSKRGPHRYVRLVNAVLRRIGQEKGDETEPRFPVDLNTPAWLRESWSRAYGDETAGRIARSLQKHPPLDITVKDDPVSWARRLGGQNIWGRTVRLARSGDISGLPGFDDGAWWVQDLAATLPAHLLVTSQGINKGATVSELCAAPGGKTAQLAAAGLKVEAVDNSASRLGLLRQNLRRLKLDANIVEADATTLGKDRVFDAVLLDAPCTATGTIRRHPEIPLLRTREDVLRLSIVQKHLLHAAINLAAASAPIVYSVCSLEAEECEQVVDTVLEMRSDVVRDPVEATNIPGLPVVVTAAGDIRTFPFHMAERGGMDGFYISCLRKTR